MAALIVAPAPAEAVTLAGITTIEAAGPSFVPVTLPHDLKLNWEQSVQDPAPRIEGASRFPAVILRRSVGTSVWELVLLRIGENPDDVSMSYLRTNGAADEARGDTFSSLTLPAGDWRLYVVGDGSRLRATMRWPGLQDAGEFHTTVPVPMELIDLPRVDAVGTGPVGAWGADGRLQSDGILFSWLRARGGVDVGDNMEACFYLGGAAGVPAAYHPGCPGGERFGSPGLLSGGDHEGTLLADNLPMGTYGLGGNLSVLGTAPTEVSFTAAWLSFQPLPGTPILDLPAPAPPAVTIPPPSAPPSANRPSRTSRKRCPKRAVRRGGRCRCARGTVLRRRRCVKRRVPHVRSNRD